MTDRIITTLMTIIVRWMNHMPYRKREATRDMIMERLNLFEAPTEDERLPSWVYDHPDVWTNPWRVGGVPCIRGTRIPVDIMLDWIEGAPDDDITEFSPDVTADVIDRLRTAREEHNDV
ncbi:hypothetical protein CFAEC_06095 [Corynebacterium faecale]|uniref:DUF433 domain-containing protein n=1 Tax=Corynebacterium faecale TaxID=1758466 RepID=UPI0025B3FFB0|nr:DUF433 domain-containing protein [Corynebacterium faecale]WJY92055.1 hypothetical protein CFAEC_06095 [Corynebacterium faecale]